MREQKGIADLIEKARTSLRAAQLLFNDGIFDFSASRSYYCMFYAAEAILLTGNLAFSKHSAVIGAFGREFVKTGLVPGTLHEYILKASELREMGDYGAPGLISQQKAQGLIQQAREFIDKIEAYLRQHGQGNGD